MLALALGGAGANAATLVVRATGPSAKLYPPGKALADADRLALKAGDTVTLLDARGTRALAGPGQFTAASPPNAAAAQGTGSRIAALASAGGVRRARIGAVRGAVPADPARAPNVWFVDAAQSATVCVPDAGAVTLWRAGSAATAATISGAAGSAEVRFAPGQSMLTWPASLPVAEGTRYDVRWEGASAPVTITFALVSPRPTVLQDMAAALIRRDCQRQLDMLIETVAVPVAATGAPG